MNPYVKKFKKSRLNRSRLTQLAKYVVNSPVAWISFKKAAVGEKKFLLLISIP